MNNLIKYLDKLYFNNSLKYIVVKLRNLYFNLFINTVPVHTISENKKNHLKFCQSKLEKNNILFQNTVIVECGVGYGSSLQFLLELFDKIDTQIFACDSFIGFPNISNNEKNKIRNPVKGEWGNTSVKAIKKKLINSGLTNNNIQKVIFLKGFFNKTLHQLKDKKISLLHIDCDLYESTKDCIEILYNSVVSGGIITFDEYKIKEWQGATRAIDEFIKNKNNIEIKNMYNFYYFIKT